MTDHSTPRRALTFWDHLAILLKWRWVVIVYMLIMLTGSVTYALLAQTWYRSVSRMLPPPSGALGLSNVLPSLAQGALGLGSMMSDEVNLVLSVLDSRELRDKVIDNFSWIEKHRIEKREKAHERYYDVVSWEYDERGMVTVKVEETSPELAKETVDFIVDEVRRQFSTITRDQARSQREFIQNRLDQNREDLAAADEELREFSAETGIISLEDQLRTSVETIAELYKQLVAAEVELDVVEATLPPTSSQVITARRRVEALKRRLRDMEHKQENEAKNLFIDIDSAPEASVRYLRLRREVEMQTTILEFLLPQYEQARIMEMREESNIYVLDHGNLPEEKSKPRRSWLVLAWLFAAFIVLYPILLFLEWLERLRAQDPDRHQFVHDTLSMLKPSRFFRRDGPHRPGERT